LSSRDSIGLLRDLKEKHPDNQTVLFELSEALADHQLQHAGDTGLGDSTAQLTEAAETFTHLCEVHPNVPKYINAMVHTYFKLAMLRERESQDATEQEKRELKSLAKAALQRAVDGYAAQVQMHPDALGYRAWYALFLYHDGKNSLSSGLYEQAVASLQSSVDQWNRVIASKPDERISWRALPDVYRNLGQAFEAIGNEKEAAAAFDMATISQQMIDLEP
jgi:tetratricopeptide (TPR) repeat protein